MPRSKTRKPEYLASQPIGLLFDDPRLAERLRQHLNTLTKHQLTVIRKIRALTPEAKNSDARNTLQAFTDHALKSNEELDDFNIGFLDFHIGLYKKKRERKEKAKREAKEKRSIQK
ncbi:hypothetical protein DYB32_009394 [Aphanomyces invadans]|uniref:Uncharacterized protein n=1 Tax=Aphanomyces invadans TaxID=157072 RepID=A0A3R6YXT7_9STRA|nr:hypothetical protein DYB32_009394 [Aphanomyces invadans]